MASSMATTPHDKPDEAFGIGRQLSLCLWVTAGIGFEREPLSLCGVNPWDYEWESLGACVQLPHPNYRTQTHNIPIWRIVVDGREIFFAAGELSNGVWGFYELAGRQNS
jgi:hypothetical protein